MMLRLTAVAVILFSFISEFNCEEKQVLHFLTKIKNGDLFLTRIEKKGSMDESEEEDIVDNQMDDMITGNDYAPGSR